MTKTPSKLYSFHVANLRALEQAISNTARMARAAIASEDPDRGLQSLLRLYAFLMGAWSESRLRKLLHEDSGYTAGERGQILAATTQLDQWRTAVDVAFRKHHGLTKAPLDERSLGVAHAGRRAALHDVLNNELRIVIEIRNKLAHGQWVYPLNSAGSDVEPDKYRLINDENLQSLQTKLQLLRHLADATHDLVVSQSTFERDFERHFRSLFQGRTNLTTKCYSKYADGLVARRQKARMFRKRDCR